MVLLFFASVAILGYLSLLGASDVHVSGGLAGNGNPLLRDNIIWHQIRDLRQSCPWLPEPTVTQVQRVDVFDALRNALFIFCVSALSVLLALVVAIAGVFKAISGLFTGRWGEFGLGTLVAVLSPLFAIGFLLVALFMWFSLLFQPCTPAYALLWLTLGFACFGAGAPAAAYPPYMIIIIFDR